MLKTINQFRNLIPNPVKRLENLLKSDGSLTIFGNDIKKIETDRFVFKNLTEFLQILTEFQRKNWKVLNELKQKLKDNHEELFIELSSIISILQDCGLKEFRDYQSKEKIIIEATGKEIVSMKTISIETHMNEKGLPYRVNYLIILEDSDSIILSSMFKQAQQNAERFLNINSKDLLNNIFNIKEILLKKKGSIKKRRWKI